MDADRLDVIRAMWQAKSMNPAGAAFRELIDEVERLKKALADVDSRGICPRCGERRNMRFECGSCKA